LNPDAIFSTLDSIEPTTIGHFIAEHLPQETFVHRNKIVGSFLAGLMFTLAAGAVGAQTRLKASLAVGGSSSQIVLL